MDAGTPINPAPLGAVTNQKVLTEDANFVAQLWHLGALVLIGNAAMTLPATADIGFQVGDFINFAASNATPCTFTDDGTSTINSAGGADALTAKWAGATAWVIGEDEWLVIGSLT